jgi:hypothetical protein
MVHAAADNRYTKGLAEFVSGLRFERIPGEVRSRLKVYGAMVKHRHAGRSAQSGLYAGLLARRGFTGIVDVFESKYGGFCTTFSRSHDRFKLEELTSGLGER